MVGRKHVSEASPRRTNARFQPTHAPSLFCMTRQNARQEIRKNQGEHFARIEHANLSCLASPHNTDLAPIYFFGDRRPKEGRDGLRSETCNTARIAEAPVSTARIATANVSEGTASHLAQRVHLVPAQPGTPGGGIIPQSQSVISNL